MPVGSSRVAVGLGGSRRWFDRRRLSNQTINALRPQHRSGIPDVTWNQADGSPSPSIAELLDQYRVKVAATAVGMIKDATTAEPAITEAIQSALPDNAALERLAYRVKSPASLCRKIRDKAWQLADPDPWNVEDKITDVLRYTVAATSRAATDIMIENLNQTGWDVPTCQSRAVTINNGPGTARPLYRLVGRYDALPVELQFRETTMALNEGGE